MPNLHHPKLAEKLNVTPEILERLRMPQLTRQLHDGSYEEPSFHTIMKIDQQLRERHKIPHGVRLGAGLHEAGVVTELEGEWLDSRFRASGTPPTG